jgi:hypothetical protein
MLIIEDCMKENKDCKCCYGSGIQYNKLTGMRVLCPCCGGSGKSRFGKRKHHFIPRTD